MAFVSLPPPRGGPSPRFAARGAAGSALTMGNSVACASAGENNNDDVQNVNGLGGIRVLCVLLRERMARVEFRN